MGIENKRTLTKTRRYKRYAPLSHRQSLSQPLIILTPTYSDLDQIKADLTSPKHLKQFKDTKAVEDLPGLGQHYCTECAKWFDMETTLVSHRRGKPHKRR